MKNEFKFSALRQFGSENVSFTATIHSDNQILTDTEIDQQINQIGLAINKSFIAVQEREISEKEILAAASDRRKAEVEKLDKALKDEMEVKKAAQQTMKDAERLSNKLTKK